MAVIYSDIGWVEGPEYIRHVTKYVVEILDTRRLGSRDYSIEPAYAACDAPLGTLQWNSGHLELELQGAVMYPGDWPTWPTCWICAAILGELMACLEPGVTFYALVNERDRVWNERKAAEEQKNNLSLEHDMY